MARPDAAERGRSSRGVSREAQGKPPGLDCPRPFRDGNPYTPRKGPRSVTDLQEAPATPPFEEKGDVRFGYYVAGGLLLAFGWGLGVVVNVLAHLLAPAGGYHLFGVEVGGSLGPYAWAVLALGLFAGAFGTGLLLLGRGSPRGPVVLPGYDY